MAAGRGGWWLSWSLRLLLVLALGLLLLHPGEFGADAKRKCPMGHGSPTVLLLLCVHYQCHAGWQSTSNAAFHRVASPPSPESCLLLPLALSATTVHTPTRHTHGTRQAKTTRRSPNPSPSPRLSPNPSAVQAQRSLAASSGRPHRKPTETPSLRCRRRKCSPSPRKRVTSRTLSSATSRLPTSPSSTQTS